MTNPTHRLKKFVKYAGNEKPADSYVYDASGWLGSGVKDCNGQEIFEGDIVNVESQKFGDDEGFVYFRFGKFLFAGQHEHAPLACELSDLKSDELEIIGHIAEEET